MALEGGDVLIGEALDAVGRRDVAVARTPEGQRVDQGFAQDDLFAGLQRDSVEHAPAAPVACRQVQMLRGAGAQVVQELPAVDLDHAALLVEDGNDQRAVEVLVAALAVQADLGQACADVGAGLAGLLGQPQAEGAVGQTQLEVRDQLGMVEPARHQVGAGLARGQQPLVVVVNRLVQQRLVVGIERHGRRQCAHGRALHSAGAGAGLGG